MRAPLVGLGALDVVDDEHIDVGSRGFQLQAAGQRADNERERRTAGNVEPSPPASYLISRALSDMLSSYVLQPDC